MQSMCAAYAQIGVIHSLDRRIVVRFAAKNALISVHQNYVSFICLRLSVVKNTKCTPSLLGVIISMLVSEVNDVIDSRLDKDRPMLLALKLSRADPLPLLGSSSREGSLPFPLSSPKNIGKICFWPRILVFNQIFQFFRPTYLPKTVFSRLYAPSSELVRWHLEGCLIG